MPYVILARRCMKLLRTFTRPLAISSFAPSSSLVRLRAPNQGSNQSAFNGERTAHFLVQLRLLLARYLFGIAPGLAERYRSAMAAYAGVRLS